VPISLRLSPHNSRIRLKEIMATDSINVEAGLGDNWIPVDQKPIIPGARPETLANSENRFLQGSIPQAFQLSPHFVDTAAETASAPRFGIMPLGIQGNPVTNAGVASTATKVVQNTPSTPSTPTVSTVELTIPSIFTPTDQTVTLPGPLVFDLATEPAGTFFSVPGGSLTALENTTSGGVSTGASSPSTLTLTASPTTATSWGIYAVAYNAGSISAPAGFTAFGGGTSHNATYFNSFTGLSPVSISQAVAVNSNATAAFAIFNGAAPSIVQQASAAFVGVTPLNKAFTSNNTAGNTIIVIVSTTNNTFGPFSLSVTDTAGNSYTTISYIQTGGVWQNSVLIAIATNIAGGANTVKAAITGTGAGGNTGLLNIVEYPPLTAAPAIPIFKPILSSDVPPVNLGSFGNGGVSGILKVGNGGTGSDLGATGGVSMFLSQLSAGAAITPTQPDFGDLAGLNKATKYNNISLVGVGLPSLIALVDRTAQTAAIGTTNLLASVPTTGQYRLSWNAKVTTVDPGSSTLGALTITYTDADNTVQTITMLAQDAAGNAVTTNTGNLTTSVLLGNTHMLNARSGTAIQYAFAYASGTPATMAYNVHIKLESM